MSTRDRPVTPAYAFPLDADAQRGELAAPSIMEQTFARFGTLASVPCVTASHADIGKMPLDPRRAFILSRVDGTLSVETIVDISGMPRDQVFGIVIDLVCMKAIALR